VAIVLLASTAGIAANAPGESIILIQELCLDTGAVWDKAQPLMQARAKTPETIAEDKMGKASLYSLKVSESARVELTVAHEDNAVMSCTVHATVADVKTTFADMQKSYGIKGPLADYMLGKPTRNVPFVARSSNGAGGKPGRKMLGLFEFQQAEGQVGGSVQAILLRDEAAAGPTPLATVKTSAAKTSAAKTAAAKSNPITTGSIASTKK
jgi:hypothetical protein